MPIRRKLCNFGTSKVVFLPKSWVELIEEMHGHIQYVTMEVNGELTIRPVLKESAP